VTAPLAVHDGTAVRWNDGDGPRLPRSYGDAAAEYRAARESAVVVDRCDRALLRCYGRDPFRILQGILSNDVALASAERAVYATLLTPKGRMLADVRVFRRADDFLIELAAAALPAVAESFRRTVPPLFARWEDVSADWHAIGVYGPEARVRLAALLGAPVPPADIEDAAAVVPVRDQAGIVVCSRITGGPGYDVIAPTHAAEGLWRELVTAGVRPMGHAPLDVLRIEAGVPCWGAELSPETIPLEAGLQARAISTGKGCYTGQEVIIRILHRGHVNWLLRGVLLGDAAGASRGTPLLQSDTGKQAGRITSSAWSPRMDQQVALAYVRREVEPGNDLRLATSEGPAARVVALPFAL
jgi:folate-binding protein YgfZ